MNTNCDYVLYKKPLPVKEQPPPRIISAHQRVLGINCYALKKQKPSNWEYLQDQVWCKWTMQWDSFRLRNVHFHNDAKKQAERDPMVDAEECYEKDDNSVGYYNGACFTYRAKDNFPPAYKTDLKFVLYKKPSGEEGPESEQDQECDPKSDEIQRCEDSLELPLSAWKHWDELCELQVRCITEMKQKWELVKFQDHEAALKAGSGWWSSSTSTVTECYSTANENHGVAYTGGVCYHYALHKTPKLRPAAFDAVLYKAHYK